MNKILLVDMDNFFSSVEELKNSSNNMPLVIAGNSINSVVSSCNSHAKKLGIKAAMPIKTALKICPNLIIRPVKMNEYIECSKKVYSILKKFTKNIESSSIDEWYLDLSQKNDFFSRNIQEIAESIKYQIYKILKLKCSIGISYNKFLAKMACENAKPFGIFEINNDNFREYLWPLSIDKMHMIGKSISNTLKLQGINTIGDLANTTKQKELRLLIGKHFDYIYNNARGITLDSVEKDHQRKSIGSGFMVYNIIMDSQEYNSLFNYHFEKIYQMLIDGRFLTDNISAYITVNHIKKIKTKKLLNKTNDKSLLYDSLQELMSSFMIKIPFDAFGLSFNNLVYEFEEYDKPELFAKKSEKLIINEVNKKLNKNVVNTASSKLKK